MRQLSLGKLTRNQLILGIAIVVLLIVNVFFAVGYFGTASTKADLDSDIATKEKYVDDNEARYNIGELQNKLAAAQQDLDDAPFLSTIEPLELVDHIIDVMKKAEIGAYTWSPGGISTVKIGGSTYHTNSYSISITSAERLTTLIKLQSYIEDLPYDAIRTNSIKLTSAGGDSWKMTFVIQIITQ
jgi:hypothetical protein